VKGGREEGSARPLMVMDRGRTAAWKGSKLVTKTNKKNTGRNFFVCVFLVVLFI